LVFGISFGFIGAGVDDKNGSNYQKRTEDNNKY
jgi:hypothetical protein